MSNDTKKPYEVFLRKGSANYWMRFSLPGQGQIRIGLKTPDKTSAEVKAAGEYQKAVWQAEHNILPGKMSFDKLAEAFLASIEPAEKTTPKQLDTYKAHNGVIQRYLSPSRQREAHPIVGAALAQVQLTGLFQIPAQIVATQKLLWCATALALR